MRKKGLGDNYKGGVQLTRKLNILGRELDITEGDVFRKESKGLEASWV